MKIFRRIIFCGFVFSFLLGGIPASAFPQLTGRVVDDAHILSTEQQQQLTQTLQAAAPYQVVAVSLNSLEGQEIEEYSVALGRHWGIGQKDRNDGVLVLIAPNQRQMRIEVGYGLEGELTDAASSQIINRVMLPLAKQGKYAEALIRGSEAVVRLLNGTDTGWTQALSEKQPNALSEKRHISPSQQDNSSFSIGLVLFYFMLIWIIRLTVPHYVYTLFKTKSNPPANISFSDQELNEIHRNRRKYISLILRFSLFYSIFFLAGIILAFQDFLFALIWLLLCFFFSFIFIPINLWYQLKQDNLFTDREYNQWIKKLYSEHSSSDRSVRWGFLHRRGSVGRGGSDHDIFFGDGGSFGGGGSSGRW